MKPPILPVLLTAGTPYMSHGVNAATATNLKYSNHVFNAVHDSMRQWGSSLNHNGMSAFIATVPEGVEFYHGTSRRESVEGMEWLAFEPEHALLFARGRGGGPPGRGPPPPPEHGLGERRWRGRGEMRGPPREGRASWGRWLKGLVGGRTCFEDGEVGDHGPLMDDDGFLEPMGDTPGTPGQASSWHRPGRSQQRPNQEPFSAVEEEEAHGYLHTYTTKHPLRLLYLDGQSAAKSTKGTLDMQDVVILQQDFSLPTASEGKPHHGPMGEYQRAQGLCKLAREDWNSQIDGILRMEGGFEIILCSFSDHLDVKSILQTKPQYGRPGDQSGGISDYYKAVAARYDGIGGGRVSIDYEDFVTLYANPDAMYFEDTGLPRARNDSKELDIVRAGISRLARRVDDNGSDLPNWQAVADMVVARYADRIEYLTTGEFQTFSAYKAVVDGAMRPFVDFGERNSTEEVARCATQFIPSGADTSSLAAEAILQVTLSICSTLEIVSTSHDFPASRELVQSLRDWLGWTAWKKCRGCAVEEVCFLPIWPMGSREDFERPRCRAAMDEGRPGGYWGGFGPPRGGDGEEMRMPKHLR